MILAVDGANKHQIKLNLKEKLEVLKKFDGEILDHLNKEKEIFEEIVQHR